MSPEKLTDLTDSFISFKDCYKDITSITLRSFFQSNKEKTKMNPSQIIRNSQKYYNKME
jgi:hypothetical protein